MDPVQTIASDTAQGADELARQAVDVLLAAPEASLARRLMEARPGMPVVANRVAAAWQSIQAGDADRVLRVLDHEAEAVRKHAAALVGPPFVTLSRSSSVDAVIDDGPVWVLESRPGGEGRETAERLAARGLDADWCPDDEAGDAVREARCVLLGCDALLRDGTVWNKVQSTRLARTARRCGVPVYVVTSTAKAAPDMGVDRLWEVSRPRDWFEAVDPSLVDAYVTEQGVLDAVDVGAWVDRWDAIREAVA